MKSMNQWLEEYGVSHQNKTNKLIHWVCVPLIFFSVYGLFSSIPSFVFQSLFPKHLHQYINYGNLLLLLALIFYFRLSFQIGVGMLLYAGLCVFFTQVLVVNTSWPLWMVSLIIFVVAWIGQFIGHHIEGEKPSFIDDLKFLLIGPAWVISYLLDKMGIKY